MEYCDESDSESESGAKKAERIPDELKILINLIEAVNVNRRGKNVILYFIY